MTKNEIIKEIKYIADQIIEKYQPDRIILFGSASRDEYDEVNDLDFLIIKENVPDIGIDRMRELDDLVDRNMAADMLVYRPDEIEDRIHQAAEKYLKAFIIAHDSGLKKIHDLPVLLKSCIEFEPELVTIAEDCKFLNRFYIDTRYPVH